MDDWHIRIDRTYLDPEAGSGARAKEQELAAGKGGLRRFFEDVLDVRTADRNWRRGAEGEEKVAARLAKKLDDRWVVIHDLTIGSRGANLDHLVLGPAGVFALNTKNLKGKITIYDRAVLHNGQNHGFLPKCRREADQVSRRLSSALGREVPVRSVLVFSGPAEAEFRGTPTDVRVIGYLRLHRWLQGLPDTLDASDLLRLERAARDPETWSPGRPTPAPRGTPTTRRAAAASPAPSPAPAPSVKPSPPAGRSDRAPAPPQPVAPPPAHDEGTTVRRWTRYGKDRFYANASDGMRLGYIDVPTGEIVLEVADETGVIAAQLRASRLAVTPPKRPDRHGD